MVTYYLKPVQRLLASGRAVREKVKKLISIPQWKNLVVGPLVAKSVSLFVPRLLGGAREIKAVCVDQVAYLPVGAQ